MTHLSAPARLLVTAEWECRVKNVVAINPDGSGTKLFRDGLNALLKAAEAGLLNVLAMVDAYEIATKKKD